MALCLPVMPREKVFFLSHLTFLSVTPLPCTFGLMISSCFSYQLNISMKRKCFHKAHLSTA